MKVTDTSKQLDLSALGEAAGGPRSPGLHASSIWRDIESTLGRYPAGQDDEESRRRRLTYQLGGFLWEGVYEHVFISLLGKSWPGSIVVHQEVERDGITGSPDLLDTVEERVIDTKCTWKSSDKLDNLEKNFWSWLVQLKSYCYMMGWNKARVVVMFVNGNYRDSGPQVKQLDFEFSQQEIQENWRMLVGHARRRGWLAGDKPKKETTWRSKGRPKRKSSGQ